MIRFTWRQFRTQAAAAFAALGAVAIVLAITGPHLAHLYDTSGIATCKAPSNCDALNSSFLSHDRLLQKLSAEIGAHRTTKCRRSSPLSGERTS